METRSHFVKKYFTMHLWRLAQTRVMVSVMLWSLSISGIFFPYFRDSYPFSKMDFYSGFLLFLIIIILLIFTTGFLYDVVLQLWREYFTIVVERNPYMTDIVDPKSIIVYYSGTYTPFMRTLAYLIEKRARGEDDIRFAESLRKRAELFDKYVHMSQRDRYISRTINEINTQNLPDLLKLDDSDFENFEGLMQS